MFSWLRQTQLKSHKITYIFGHQAESTKCDFILSTTLQGRGCCPIILIRRQVTKRLNYLSKSHNLYMEASGLSSRSSDSEAHSLNHKIHCLQEDTVEAKVIRKCYVKKWHLSLILKCKQGLDRQKVTGKKPLDAGKHTQKPKEENLLN